jgi:hypothetical protein
MKTKVSLLLLSFSGITLSKPVKQAFYDAGSNRQVVMQGQVFDVPSNPQPGFSLNLEELRLVQLSEGQEPIWMTELEKVRITHCAIELLRVPFSTHRVSFRSRLKPKDFASSTCTYFHFFV